MEDKTKIKQPEPKVDRYITDMKELPPASEPVEDKKSDTQVAVQERKPAPIPTKPENIETKVGDKKSDPEPTLRRAFTLKDAVLAFVNLVTLVALIVLLTKLPSKATEFRAERIKEFQNESNPTQLFGDLSDDLKKSEELNSLFLDEPRIVNFVGDVEKLKSTDGSIQKVLFASQKAVKDKNGFFGVPVIIELKGNWQSISVSLAKIQGLPYLFKPVNMEVVPAKDDSGLIVFSYGGFLYVSDKVSAAQ